MSARLNRWLILTPKQISNLDALSIFPRSFFVLSFVLGLWDTFFSPWAFSHVPHVVSRRSFRLLHPWKNKILRAKAHRRRSHTFPWNTLWCLAPHQNAHERVCMCGRCRSEVSACACSHHLERHLLLRHPQPPLSCCHSIPFLGSLFSVSELIYRWVFAPVPCVAVACALSFIFGQRRSYFLLASVVAPAWGGLGGCIDDRTDITLGRLLLLLLRV